MNVEFCGYNSGSAQKKGYFRRKGERGRGGGGGSPLDPPLSLQNQAVKMLRITLC